MTIVRSGRAAPLALASLALCASLFAAAPARAQTAPHDARAGFREEKTAGGSSVVFDDDLAQGGALDPFADIVKAPPHAARMGLLRPRTNFVPDMLKSVENL